MKRTCILQIPLATIGDMKIAILRVILFISGISTVQLCRYVMKDLQNPIEVDNNLNHGETIFTFTLLDDSGQIVTDKYLVPDYSQPVMNRYFRIIQKPGVGYVSEIGIEKNCPPPGTFETFYLTLQYDNDCKYTVNVEVAAAIPDFSVQPMVEIHLSQIKYTVTVLRFQLNNIRKCAQFVCSVEALISNKSFTIETGTFMVRTNAEDVRFDFNYQLQITCSPLGAAISDKNKAKFIAVFRNNMTQISSFPTKSSAESTSYKTEMNRLANFSTNVFHFIKSSSKFKSTSDQFWTSYVFTSSKLGEQSTDKDALTGDRKDITALKTNWLQSTVTVWMSHAEPKARSLITILQSKGNNTYMQTPSSEKVETRTSTRNNMTFVSTSSLSTFLLTPLSGKLTTGIYLSTIVPPSNQSPGESDNILESPANIAAVSTTAGVVGLGAAGTLIYLASRRCRIPPVVSPADDKEEQEDREVSQER